MKLKLFLIIILAVGIRLFGLLPSFSNPGVYVDEAAIGYTSYSLLHTGLDEYGKAWPILLRTFGTYSSSLYAYLTTPFIWLANLNDLSLRLPSAIAGVGLVIVVFIGFGPTAALLITLSPIFVFFSRTATESNLALFILFTGLVCIWRSTKSSKFLFYGSLLISLSSYTYQAQRLISPLILAGILLTHRSKKAFIYISLAFLLQLPLFYVSLTSAGHLRATSLSTQETSFVYRYLAYFSPKNLFSKPDPDPQRSFPNTSVFFWWYFGLAIIALFNYSSIPHKRSLLGLLLLLPLPAALTKDYFATLRALPMFVIVAIFLSRGLKNRLIIWTTILFSLLGLYSNIILLRHEKSTIWNYEFAQLSTFITSHPTSTILLDNSRQKPVEILLRYYLHPEPQKIQTANSRDIRQNYYHLTSYTPQSFLPNLVIRPLNWQTDVYTHQLIVADNLTISPDQVLEHKITQVQTITDINGLVTLTIYQTHPDQKCLHSTSPLCP